MTDETIEPSQVEAWKCDGCGHLTNDMVADIKSIKDAGGLSCCPERKMQPLYMSTPHSTAVSAALRAQVQRTRDEIIEECAKIVSAYAEVAARINQNDTASALTRAAQALRIQKGNPAIAQERDVGEWQPIETAPKGRKVIVSVPNGNNRPPITMMGRYWRRGSLEVAEGFEDEDWADVIDEISYMPEGWYEDCEVEDAPAHNITPTHWMPLPSPPTTSPSAISEAPTSADAVKTSPEVDR